MEKKYYYVTLKGDIREELDNNDSDYDFEVYASDEEIRELENLFKKSYDDDFGTFVEAHVPYRTKKSMQKNRTYDGDLSHIYEMIYRLGSEETKNKMVQSGLI